MASRREIDDSDEEGDDDSQREEDDAPSRKRRSISGGRSRMQRFKAWFRDARLDLYFIFFAGSILFFVLGFMAMFAPRAFGPGLESWFGSLGGGNVYFFVGGIFALLVTGYLFGGLIIKREEFKRLVQTKAKSDFIRNLDKVERLAFELGTKESQIVADKKKAFKIRH